MHEWRFVAERVDHLIGSAFSPDLAKDKEILKTQWPSITKLAEGARRHQAFGEAAG